MSPNLHQRSTDWHRMVMVRSNDIRVVIRQKMEGRKRE